MPVGLKLGLKSTFVDLRAGTTPKARPVPNATAVGHSEEHLVLETVRAADFPVGTAV